MNYLLLGGTILDVILLIVLCIFKRDKLIWNALLCSGLLPLIFVTTCLSGNMDIKDALSYGMLASISLFFIDWYIYVPALVISIISFYNIFLNKKTEEM